MNGFDLMWAAGLLEGEGCFTVLRNKRKDGTIATRYPRVQCGMTDEDSVLHLAEVLDCGSVNGPYEQKNKAHKSYWNWSVTGKRATDMMMLLFPLMGERRRGRVLEVFDECGVA